ncbi:sugar epimerase [Paenibacillus sp. FSL H7-0326]|uniref:DUF2716 domain-containing protein n=1 Tax=Paenibacillus sp. FSL H7-0326 TaxID=1921144 RepID=UPI00096C765C|nr:DUF2716 domain-containing protein [Paenibacillus sp. FSL H7-0326]OMC71768.1 sugar epimerase [Paenibacillus sp. FSL H7-0326]
MNWIPLSDEEYNQVWDRIGREFHFRPSISPRDWPTFFEKSPFITYDVSDFNEDDIDDLEKKCLSAFKASTNIDEFMYALDWQHESFLYNPHLETSRVAQTIRFYPDGEYYLFLKSDFSWGYLSHPWEKTICIFGEELIKNFEIYKPRLFSKIARRSR